MRTDHPGMGRRYRRSAGLTLVEMMLAMAGIGLVGLAIAAMLVAVAYGTESSRDLRTLVVRHKIVESRLTAAVRSSRMVLHRDQNNLLLWQDDIDRNEEPGAVEVRLIRLDPDTNELAAWRIDRTGLSEQQIQEANTVISFDSNFEVIIEDFLARDDVTAITWLEAVQAVDYTLNHVDPHRAGVLAYRVTVTTGEISNTVIGTAALRNR